MPRFPTLFNALGYGLGLRPPFYEEAAAGRIPVDWFEAVTENFLGGHPGHAELLADTSAHYPLALHGVALNIGGADALDTSYLTRLKALADAVRPVCISDHLCWTAAGGVQSHDLLPLPYTAEALCHVADRVSAVQDRLGRPLALENASSYAQFAVSTMPEEEFLATLAERTGCHILLDVNNVYVSAFNYGRDAKRYIDALPADRIAYLHLAGHRDCRTHLIDTHDERVADEVWKLYRHATLRLGETATLLEWDDSIPELPVLLAELAKAREIAQAARQKRAS